MATINLPFNIGNLLTGTTLPQYAAQQQQQQRGLANQLQGLGQQLQGLQGLGQLQWQIQSGTLASLQTALWQQGQFLGPLTQMVVAESPEAFLPDLAGEYDEVHASVPLDLGGDTFTASRFPEIHSALLRQELEKQGIKFDSSMGAPPTMADLQGQLQGHWSFWTDQAKLTYELTQRMPRRLKCMDGNVSVKDCEATFERELMPVMERLVAALKAA